MLGNFSHERSKRINPAARAAGLALAAAAGRQLLSPGGRRIHAGAVGGVGPAPGGPGQHLADLASLCDRLLALMAEPFDLDGHQVSVGLSLGVALYPRDGTDGETLMRNADTARYMAKRAGRQTYRFFEPRMNDELERFIQIRDALRDALERQEFVLHYRGKGGLRLRPR